jgi:hypothetical protein
MLILGHEKKNLSKMLTYTSPLFVGMDTRKFRIIFVMLQGIMYQSLNFFKLL